jgi:cytoskeletal protein CcmA (bactofilin family)
MRGDYSRRTFDPQKHYSGVLMQQGRVQTDADFNEQSDIAMYRMETEVKDFVGQSGVPEDNPGFGIGTDQDGATVTIGPGRCYVEGMLMENEAGIDFAAQKDMPSAKLPSEDGVYLAYMEAERGHITAIEDPDIREAALGNQDTAARMKNLWRVKMLKLAAPPDDDKKASFKPGTGWNPEKETKKSGDLPLSAGFVKAKVTKDNAKDLGNQLYRIEIHKPGPAGEATFKWSRDNGAVGAEVTAVHDKTITVNYIGRGTEAGFAANDLIEITNDRLESEGKPGILAKVAFAADDSLTLEITEEDNDLWHNEIIGGGATATPERLSSFHTRARKWDCKTAALVPTAGDTFSDLEHGLSIAFAGDKAGGAGGYYKTGDYWLIASRSYMKDIYWKKDSKGDPAFVTANGVIRYYSCLALLTKTGEGWALTEDLRVKFRNMIKGLLNKSGDTMTGDLVLEKNLTVQGLVKEDLKLEKNLTVKGDLTVTGKTVSKDTEHIEGDVQLGNDGDDTVTVFGKLKSGHSSGALKIEDTLSVSENVGIGTDTPSAKLDVNGDVKAASFQGNGSALKSLDASKITSGQLTAHYNQRS